MKYKIGLNAPSNVLDVSDVALEMLRKSRKIKARDVTATRHRDPRSTRRYVTFTTDTPYEQCESVLKRIFGRYYLLERDF